MLLPGCTVPHAKHFVKVCFPVWLSFVTLGRTETSLGLCAACKCQDHAGGTADCRGAPEGEHCALSTCHEGRTTCTIAPQPVLSTEPDRTELCCLQWQHSTSRYCLEVKLSLCLIKRHSMKAYVGEEVQLHAFLTLALDRHKWSVSRPGRFISE